MTHAVVVADAHIRRTGARRLPDADVDVFGHSHIPWDDAGVDGQLLFNPGAPTERRARPHHTLGTLDLDGGRVVSRIHVLG